MTRLFRTQAEIDVYLEDLAAKMRRIQGRDAYQAQIREERDIEADEGPESVLQGKIEAWAKEWGKPCLSFRQSKKAKGFITPGWPDVTLALASGRTVYLELKSAKGTVKQDQTQIHLQLMALGHEVHVIRSFKAFLEVVNA